MADLHAEFVPFTAQTRMSGVNLDGRHLRKGAGDAVIKFVTDEGGRPPAELQPVLDRIGREGGTPLAVARDSQVMGVIYLKDTIKEGMRERFDHLRAMGIRTIMITGDNRLTAAKIAEESGVDDFLAEATPEKKLELIKEQQATGRMVAMTGDGTNDAPALAQADVGVAMNTGTQAAREAGNMVDLDSNPTKLIEIVEVGKQLLITRGALTTFSIANDVAKYFAILPAIFATTWATQPGGKSPLHVLNVLHLGTPQSAIISAIIFNAIVIPLLIPLALAGRSVPADRRERAAAAQPLDLRARRADRPVHRHQADRPDRPQSLRGVMPPCPRRTHTPPLDVHQSRGHHKIFLGMAAGVGKTYQMLREGQAEAENGRDVVIGYLEPHGRVETVAQAEGLETVPRRRVAYRDSVLEEMDLPALIRRQPELALIDELAHTNAPGLEHPKRYEDVEDVLAAGIDVFSTVNVQHLESLNDQVAELTGIRVRETVPDAVIGEADEVVLIDITPQSLIERLLAGKVYPPSACRPRSTTSSRSRTSPRCARSRSGRSPRRSRPSASRLIGRRPRARSGRPGDERLIDTAAPGAVGERLLALITLDAKSQRVVRRAWRSAQRLGAELDVLWVADHEPSESEQEQLDALRRLASVLGAHLLIEHGDDVARSRSAWLRTAARLTC